MAAAERSRNSGAVQGAQRTIRPVSFDTRIVQQVRRLTEAQKVAVFVFAEALAQGRNRAAGKK